MTFAPLLKKVLGELAKDVLKPVSDDLTHNLPQLGEALGGRTGIRSPLSV